MTDSPLMRQGGPHRVPVMHTHQHSPCAAPTANQRRLSINRHLPSLQWTPAARRRAAHRRTVRNEEKRGGGRG